MITKNGDKYSYILKCKFKEKKQNIEVDHTLFLVWNLTSEHIQCIWQRAPVITKMWYYKKKKRIFLNFHMDVFMRLSYITR